jgi:hypothetical protein
MIVSPWMRQTGSVLGKEMKSLSARLGLSQGWGSDSCIAEDLSLLGCDTISGEWFLTSWRTRVPSSSRAFLACTAWCLKLILWNFGNYSPNDMVSHLRRVSPTERFPWQSLRHLVQETKVTDVGFVLSLQSMNADLSHRCWKCFGYNGECFRYLL